MKGIALRTKESFFVNEYLFLGYCLTNNTQYSRFRPSFSLTACVIEILITRFLTPHSLPGWFVSVFILFHSLSSRHCLEEYVSLKFPHQHKQKAPQILVIQPVIFLSWSENGERIREDEGKLYIVHTYVSLQCWFFLVLSIFSRESVISCS